MAVEITQQDDCVIAWDEETHEYACGKTEAEARINLDASNAETRDWLNTLTDDELGAWLQGVKRILNARATAQ